MSLGEPSERVPLQTVPESTSRDEPSNDSRDSDKQSESSDSSPSLTELNVSENNKPDENKTTDKPSKDGWFCRDMRQPHLAWVKVVFFLQSASLVSLYPYLTIHMRSLGFTVEDTALVNTALPLADIIGRAENTERLGVMPRIMGLGGCHLMYVCKSYRYYLLG